MIAATLLFSGFRHNAVRASLLRPRFSVKHFRAVSFEYYGLINAPWCGNLLHKVQLKPRITIDEIFSQDGLLSKVAIVNAQRIQHVGLYNPTSKVYQELSKRGDVYDWGKYRTRGFYIDVPALQLKFDRPDLKAHIHFYKHSMTNEVYYDMDFKVKFHVSGEQQMPVKEFLEQVPSYSKFRLR